MKYLAFSAIRLQDSREKDHIIMLLGNMYMERTEAAKGIGKKAYSLFKSGKYLCSEAVLLVINEAFDGRLNREQVLSLSAPFCEGIGQTGCLCGAVSGAIMGCGLILLRDSSGRKRREMARKIASTIHESFKTENRSTCCRVLSQKVKNDKKRHVEQCASFTAYMAEKAAFFIMQEKASISSLYKVDMSKNTDIKGFSSFLMRVINTLMGYLSTLIKQTRGILQLLSLRKIVP